MDDQKKGKIYYLPVKPEPTHQTDNTEATKEAKKIIIIKKKNGKD